MSQKILSFNIQDILKRGVISLKKYQNLFIKVVLN